MTWGIIRQLHHYSLSLTTPTPELPFSPTLHSRVVDFFFSPKTHNIMMVARPARVVVVEQEDVAIQ